LGYKKWYLVKIGVSFIGKMYWEELTLVQTLPMLIKKIKLKEPHS
jgi:hypothetical protein